MVTSSSLHSIAKSLFIKCFWWLVMTLELQMKLLSEVADLSHVSSLVCLD